MNNEYNYFVKNIVFLRNLIFSKFHNQLQKHEYKKVNVSNTYLRIRNQKEKVSAL